MDKKIKVIGFSILTIFIMCTSTVSAIEELEWKVSVGDSKTYVMSNYYDPDDADGDGDNAARSYLVENEDGDMVAVKMEQGDKLKVEITKLNGGAIGRTTFYGNVTVTTKQDSEDMTIYVIQTIDNKTYWEEQATAFGWITVEGNLIVFNGPDLDKTFITKFNYKTGWLECMYLKKGEFMMEYEASGGSAPGFEIFSVLFGLFATSVILLKKKS